MPTASQDPPRAQFVYGEGTNCEAATWESYQWCYVYFSFPTVVGPPDPCGIFCVTTLPLLQNHRNSILASIARLSSSTDPNCWAASGRLQQLLNSSRISRRIPQDWGASGGTIWATTWVSYWPFNSQALHLWMGLFGQAQHFIDFILAHEMYHDMWASGDEVAADAFATSCVGSL